MKWDQVSTSDNCTLRLPDWFFQIATAKLFAYDLATQQFQPIEPEP